MEYEEAKRMTAERMADPRPGDRYHEMFAFWVKVIHRGNDAVVSQASVCEGWRPARLDTIAEFAARFAYGSIPGFWVLYADSEASIKGVPDEGDGRTRW